MKKIFVSIILIFSSVLTFACNCRYQSVREGFDNSDIVIYGKIKSISIKKVKVKDDFFGRKRIKVRKYIIEIIEVYKGDSTKRKHLVYSEYSGSSCGVLLQKNKEYIIYSKLKGDIGWTGRCSRTTADVKRELECIKNRSLENCYCENITWKKECR